MTEQQRPRAPRNRLTLALIFVIFLLPVVAAWWLFLRGDTWQQRGTTNYGTLVVPARPVDLSRLRPLGSAQASDESSRQWTLLTVAGRSCDSRCESNLYKMRQLRLALGEDRRRVRRVLVLTEAPVDPAFQAVLQGHDGLRLVTGDAQALRTALTPFAGDGLPDPTESRYIYLVDPLGNFMMTYRSDAEPKPMLKDLQRLLKVSQVG